MLKAVLIIILIAFFAALQLNAATVTVDTAKTYQTIELTGCHFTTAPAMMATILWS